MQRSLTTQWVIARSLCVYRCLGLEHVPRSNRHQALMLKLSSLVPFRRAGHYVVWNGGWAMIWSWDEQERESALAEMDDPPSRFLCIPESLLQSPPELTPGQAAVRLMQIRSGVELQVWRDDGLVMSHYFRTVPKPADCLALLRSVSCKDSPSSLSPVDAELLGFPWADSAIDAMQFQWERWIPYGLAALLVLGSGISLGSGLSWWWAERELQARYDGLILQVEPLINARNLALRANQSAIELGSYLRGPSQTELLEQVAGMLPEDSRLLAWRTRGSELEFQISTTNLDPRFYVTRFMEAGRFENVRVEPLPRAEGLSLSVTLVHMEDEG